MRSRFITGLAAALIFVASLPAHGAPAGPRAKAKAKAKPAAAVPVIQQLKAAQGSSLKVLGDSTLHKWEASASQLSISASADGSGELLALAEKGGLKSLELKAAVEGLLSNENESMNKNMYKAMESVKFPEISFVMSGYDIKGDEVTARGSLTIHGVSKEVELKGRLSGKDGSLEVKGSFPMLMSDFGVKPPVMMLGTVRVADKISIAYDFSLEKNP